jgi:hypothetical protein
MHSNIKVSRKAFDLLSYVFDSANVNHADDLLRMCMEEEKGHRGFMDGFNRCHPDAASVKDCARMFAVKRVAEYLLKDRRFPTGQDFLHTQKSCFQAAAIADEFGDKVRAAWDCYSLERLAEMDYCDVVRPRSGISSNNHERAQADDRIPAPLVRTYSVGMGDFS